MPISLLAHVTIKQKANTFLKVGAGRTERTVLAWIWEVIKAVLRHALSGARNRAVLEAINTQSSVRTKKKLKITQQLKSYVVNIKEP